MSDYLKKAALMLQKAERAAIDDGFDSDEYAMYMNLASQYARLAEIERGPVPTYIVQGPAVANPEDGVNLPPAVSP